MLNFKHISLAIVHELVEDTAGLDKMTIVAPLCFHLYVVSCLERILLYKLTCAC